MYLNKKLILESITKDNIIKICAELGCTQYKEDSQGNLCFSTYLCHGGDSPYKLVYYANEEEKKGMFHCFTCGETYDVIQLVIRARRIQGQTCTWYKALQWIAQITGHLYQIKNEDVEEQKRITQDFTWINQIRKAQNKRHTIPTLRDINENLLDLFCYIPHEEWLNDNCSPTALDRYEIGYFPDLDCISIPHRDMNGRLIGIRGRFLDEEDIERHGKYMPLKIENVLYNHQLGSNLYGLCVVLDHVKEIKKIALVEAEKSCVQSYSYFGEDNYVVATCGSAITQTQIKILLDLGVQEVIYMPDRDYHDANSFEAEAWMNKQIKKLIPLLPFVRVCLVADSKERLDYKDSPTDKGKEILLELLDEKIEINKELIDNMNK